MKHKHTHFLCVHMYDHRKSLNRSYEEAGLKSCQATIPFERFATMVVTKELGSSYKAKISSNGNKCYTCRTTVFQGTNEFLSSVTYNITELKINRTGMKSWNLRDMEPISKEQVGVLLLPISFVLCTQHKLFTNYKSFFKKNSLECVTMWWPIFDLSAIVQKEDGCF